MEGQRSFRYGAFVRETGPSKLPKYYLSPERATKEFKYGTSDPRRRHGGARGGFW